MNNILGHSASNGIKFYSIIPYNCEGFYVEMTSDPKCLGLHVGQAKNFALFQTELEVGNFREVLFAIRNGKLCLDSIYLRLENER